MSTLAQSRHSAKFVTAFARGLQVIATFGPQSERMTVAEAAARTGLDRAVTRRLLLTMVELGYATADGKQFELTSQVLRLGFSYLAAMGLDVRLQPHLDCLSRAIQESVSVSMLDGTDVVFVARSDAAGRQVASAVRIGTRLPAFIAASGRMLLSMQPEGQVLALMKSARLHRATRYTVVDRHELMRIIQKARKDGYVINDQETEEGLLGVAVLLRNRSGRAVASLNANSHVARVKKQHLVREIVPRLQDCANRLSSLLL
jgi:IclR family transcriptional regulator, pca regulon regulatory protein